MTAGTPDITRRAFLSGTVSVLAAPLYGRLHDHYERFGEPLMLPPNRPQRIFYVEEDGDYDYGLRILTDAPREPPPLTYRQALIKYWGVKPGELLLPSDLQAVYDDYEIEPEEIDGLADTDFYYENWLYSDSPLSDAYDALGGLDLGPVVDGLRDDDVGMTFIDRPTIIACSIKGVFCDDEFAVSLLQARLNEIGQNIEVRTSGWEW